MLGFLFGEKEHAKLVSMIEVIVTLIFGVLILGLLEKLHQQGKIETETSRKIIHIVTGFILVSWPFFVGWTTILIVEVFYLVLAALVRKFFPLESQHGVKRKSWGEFFFSFGVIGSILLGAPRWVFVLAILHLALADAAAALIGVKYGKKNQYKIFKQTKSIAGTGAFFLVSCVLVVLTFVFVPNYVTDANRLAILLLPFITTSMENIGAYGTDNLLIPLSVILVLGV